MGRVTNSEELPAAVSFLPVWEKVVVLQELLDGLEPVVFAKDLVSGPNTDVVAYNSHNSSYKVSEELFDFCMLRDCVW